MKENCCIILCGYKKELYDSVFGRIDKFLPKDKFDIYFVTAGLKPQQELIEWSKKLNAKYYVYDKSNIAGEAMNSCIDELILRNNIKYKYLLKIDEDIFITKNSIETLIKTYDIASYETKPAFVSPILPINSNCYIDLLNRYNVKNVYEEKFGKCKIGNFTTYVNIESDCGSAQFMWGNEGYLPHLDDINRDCFNSKTLYKFATNRFSIGVVLLDFTKFVCRGKFLPTIYDLNRIEDEVCLNSWFAIYGEPIVISNKCVCGHFSFNSQYNSMIEYYNNNRYMFEIKES